MGVGSLHATRRGKSLRESSREIPLRFEGEVKAAGGKDLRQRKARMFENSSTWALRIVVPEANDVCVRVVPGWLRICRVVPGGGCETIEADFMDPSYRFRSVCRGASVSDLCGGSDHGDEDVFIQNEYKSALAGSLISTLGSPPATLIRPMHPLMTLFVARAADERST